MLGQYIQAPYINTIFGLATPALIISVVYLFVLASLLIFAKKKGALKIELGKFHKLMKGNKNKIIISMIGYVVFIFSCINLPEFLGEENIIIKISETYLKFETLVFILLFVFLCTAFLNNTNRETHIKAANCIFRYLIWISLGTGILFGQIEYTYWKNVVVIVCAWVLNGMFFFIDISSIQDTVDNLAKFDLIPYGAVKSTDALFPSHKKQAEDIVNIISNSSANPFSICLSGEWGTGKTSVINGVAEMLKETEDNPYDIIYINALEIDNKKTLLAYLMAQIREKLKSRGVYVGINSEYKEFAASFAGTMTSSAIGTFLQKKLANNDDYREQKAALEKVLERTYQNGKLVVIVDDIERCNRKTARECLFLIKEVATMRSCVSLFVTDYDMLNKLVSNGKASNSTHDFLNKFFNYKIDLREEDPKDILTYYDGFFNQKDPAFWSIYSVICKSPGTWYNEAVAGLTAKLKELEDNSNHYLFEEDKQKQLEIKIQQQKECLSLYTHLMQNPRNVAKFYNVFRNYALYCEKQLHLCSNNDDVSKYIDSRNIGQVLYLISFIEVFLPAEYKQLKRMGAHYLDYPLEAINSISNTNRRLLIEFTHGLIFGAYFEFKELGGYIKEDIWKFVEHFLSRDTELYQLINSFTSQEEKWMNAIDASNYQLIEENWDEIVLAVLQKVPNRETGITNAWRNKRFLFLLEFAEEQIKTGNWPSDKLFSLFDSELHIERSWALGTGLMQTFWKHIEKSMTHKRPSKERANDFCVFVSHYAYARASTLYKLAHYLIPSNSAVKTDNIQEYLLNSNNPFSENLVEFLKKIGDAIPDFSFSSEGWYSNLLELTNKIKEYLVSQGIADYSDMSEDILHMLDTAEEFRCLEKIVSWVGVEGETDSRVAVLEDNIDNIDVLIDFFDKGFNELPSDIREQRELEKKFTNLFKRLQQAEGLTLTKEQLRHLHQLVEKFVELFGISSLPYRKTLLNISVKE